MHFVVTGKNLSLKLHVQICTNMCFIFLIKPLSLVTALLACKLKVFLISNFRRVVKIVFFLLDDYPAFKFGRRVIIQEKEYKINPLALQMDI